MGILHNLKKSGEGPGGKFNGPSVNHIIGWSKDENLQDLKSRLPFEAEAFIRYFKSIKELHQVCISSKFDQID